MRFVLKAHALVALGVVVLSCSADRADATSVVESGTASARIADLRERFGLPIPAVTAPRFEAAAGPEAATHIRTVLPGEALRGIARPAHVSLPLRANGQVRLEDETSRVSVGFVLDHVQNAPVEVVEGVALYRGALDGADVVHRVHAEGTEDFVVFAERPAREELTYTVDVASVRGLRLVSNTLEFLDDTGTPLLRVAPPYVVDARRQRHEARLAVSGCAYDTSPIAPWGRKVTSPGADRCTLHVSWGNGVVYPAVVDPAWSATGSMATARAYHTASVLPRVECSSPVAETTTSTSRARSSSMRRATEASVPLPRRDP